MYYALILLSVVMFGGCFALNDAYRKLRSSSMESSFMGSLAGLIVLLFISGFDFRLHRSPFSSRSFPR